MTIHLIVYAVQFQEGPFHQVDCNSSDRDFPLVARSAGFSCVGMYLNDVPPSDLISFNLFVTNVERDFVLCNHCSTHWESVHRTLAEIGKCSSFSMNRIALVPINTPNNSNLGIVIPCGAKRVFEKTRSAEQLHVSGENWCR